MIEIDGSYGEGGGQILRTALALSGLCRKPFRIRDIRKGRRRPGLRPQHLTTVLALQKLCSAQVDGAKAGSTELSFAPDEVSSGAFTFDIGTAGSTSLVLQTLLPVLALAAQKSTVLLRGGTHVPFSPSFHYLAEIFVPYLARLGVAVRLSLENCGFYPRGGGRIHAEIEPCRRPLALQMPERGRLRAVSGLSAVANLPLTIAERQRRAALERLGGAPELGCPLRIERRSVPGTGRGTFLFLRLEAEHALAGWTALGALGKRAEAVGEEAAGELLDFVRSGAAVDRHLADQIVLYLALADAPSAFSVAAVSRHLLTNLWVIGRFLPCRFRVDGVLGEPATVRIEPAGGG